MKKYAIWNHKRQRFASEVFSSRTDAEIFLHEKDWNHLTKSFYIVEWEIKDDSV